MTCYEWGHNVTQRPEVITYSNVIIVPDPHLLAPAEGNINHLKFFNVENYNFKIVVLKSIGTTTSRKYAIKQVSEVIHLASQGVSEVDVRGSRLAVSKDNVIGFQVFDKMPIPYENKIPCSSSQRHLLHEVYETELTLGDQLDFITQVECLTFSYSLVVSQGEHDERQCITVDTYLWWSAHVYKLTIA